jgi:hypothetical protein
LGKCGVCVRVVLAQVNSFDMFGCYAPAALEYAFKHWRFASGFKGYLNMDDFVR